MKKAEKKQLYGQAIVDLYNADVPIYEILNQVSEAHFNIPLIYEVLRDHNVTLKGQHRRTSDPERVKLAKAVIEDYNAGVSVVDVCEKHYISPVTLYRLLKRFGVPQRGGQGKRKGAAGRDADIIQDYIEGYTYDEISKKYGLSHPRIYQITRAANIDKRKLKHRIPARPEPADGDETPPDGGTVSGRS